MIKGLPRLRDNRDSDRLLTNRENSRCPYLPLNMLCQLETKNRTRKDNTVLDNALLDSFLLHARVLYDFFCTPPSPHKDPDGNIDDVSAEQFLNR